MRGRTLWFPAAGAIAVLALTSLPAGAFTAHQSSAIENGKTVYYYSFTLDASDKPLCDAHLCTDPDPKTKKQNKFIHWDQLNGPYVKDEGSTTTENWSLGTYANGWKAPPIGGGFGHNLHFYTGEKPNAHCISATQGGPRKVVSIRIVAVDGSTPVNAHWIPTSDGGLEEPKDPPPNTGPFPAPSAAVQEEPTPLNPVADSNVVISATTTEDDASWVCVLATALSDPAVPASDPLGIGLDTRVQPVGITFVGSSSGAFVSKAATITLHVAASVPPSTVFYYSVVMPDDNNMPWLWSDVRSITVMGQ